jgi:hypothetical protein
VYDITLRANFYSLLISQRAVAIARQHFFPSMQPRIEDKSVLAVQVQTSPNNNNNKYTITINNKNKTTGNNNN